MNHTFPVFCFSVLASIAALAVHLFGWLYALLGTLAIVVLICSGLVLRINARAQKEPPNFIRRRDIYDVKPEPELDLTRLLHNRPSPGERDQLTETGRVIHRDLRPKLNGTTPHSHERKSI